MAIPRLVVQTSAQSTNSNDVTTSGITTTGATFLVAVVVNKTGSTPTLSDSKSNAWTGLTAQSITAPHGQVRIWYAANPTVGSAHTFALSTVSGSLCALSVMAFDGVATTLPFDVENGATSTGGGTSFQAGSITPSANTALVIVGMTTDTTVVGCSVDGICATTADYADSANAKRLTAGYGVQATAAAINPTWSWLLSASNRVAVIASFKVVGGTVAPSAYGFFLD